MLLSVRLPCFRAHWGWREGAWQLWAISVLPLSRKKCDAGRQEEQPSPPSRQVWWQQLSCWLSVNLLTANEVKGEVPFSDIHRCWQPLAIFGKFFPPPDLSIILSLFRFVFKTVCCCCFSSAVKLIKMDISNKLSSPKPERFFHWVK